MKAFDWLTVLAAMILGGLLTLTGFTFGLLSRNLVDCCRKPDCCPTSPCAPCAPCCPTTPCDVEKKCPNKGTQELYIVPNVP